MADDITLRILHDAMQSGFKRVQDAQERTDRKVDTLQQTVDTQGARIRKLFVVTGQLTASKRELAEAQEELSAETKELAERPKRVLLTVLGGVLAAVILSIPALKPYVPVLLKWLGWA